MLFSIVTPRDWLTMYKRYSETCLFAASHRLRGQNIRLVLQSLLLLLTVGVSLNNPCSRAQGQAQQQCISATVEHKGWKSRAVEASAMCTLACVTGMVDGPNTSPCSRPTVPSCAVVSQLPGRIENGSYSSPNSCATS